MNLQKAILSFDLEFWYNSEFLKKYLPPDGAGLPDLVEESLYPLLDLLSQYNIKATFFVLGRLAEKYPHLIKRIANLGHEVASHGYSHKTLRDLNEIEFEKEIKASCQIIYQIIGQKPLGFRAPNLSLNNQTKWALRILEKYNFKYDSSLSPLSTSKIEGPIKEILPSLGGIYFRVFPLKIYLYLLKLTTKHRLPVLYLHPHELYNFVPELKSIPWLKKKIKFWGTKYSFKKFEKLLKEFNFVSIDKYLCSK